MALRREMNALRDHLETLELTDGIDALRRQLTNLVAELATPNKQKVALLQNYTRMLQLVFRVGDATQRHVTRAEGSLRRLWSTDLLDLCMRFNVDLDRVETNLLTRSQTAPPQDPGMVGARRTFHADAGRPGGGPAPPHAGTAESETCLLYTSPSPRDTT